ncbi:hypothetical protein MA5S0422_3948 [Mycobacteroides abscessus 5S-0422]|uniref:Uncharacterized protein n=2 Tax=Mycobacteroides abscessus subsp. bolletii TaxID=319705 RepID=X8DGL3_9MYCO|nr:hypothetical protein MA5S0422_3948 [Mycobacteroides abscessus 5S-0422]EIU08095.1 hypothetical protein MA5S0421_3029 [Mycobacteroides abscessus 5S-0421]EIU11835.1 hypothetical protein MA5S0304_2774 [Mycobacteroides abscessus 5S-0304]EIU20517.1 hypothetical protein MA5S0708_2701 [Mycobacteroides abscessus 5S-0708]EIU24548.1 hypothetical protein MA5S0817_2320 [Mycobacteroides abscessus 5S-0817]EIU32182.1 hypothetical protein MA5S1212_2457 [Mycobacteroides abscessus 5S-1212]EIU44903.1 hypothet
MELSTKVEGDHILVSADNCSLDIRLNIDEAEEHAAELNQAIADLRANQKAARS